MHGAPLGDAEIDSMTTLNWPHPPFEIPAEILNAWRAVGAKGAIERKAWQRRYSKSQNARPSLPR